MATTKARRPSFSSSPTALLAVPYTLTPGEPHNFDLTTSSNPLSTTSSNDPPYLLNQMRSAEWLEKYGLQSQKLTFDQILQRIGFKRVEAYNSVVGKNITAKYAGNLYNEVQHENGDRYVLTCRPEKLREYIQRLQKMLHLLRKRLNFLTSGSRRLFGLISEPSVCLICDCKTFDYRLFSQVQAAVTSLLKEQITKIKKFNIIWVSNDNEQFREQPVDVNSANIDKAIDWICDRKCPKTKISQTATCEAVLKAFNNNVDTFYLISEGHSSDYARETLRDNIVKTRLASQSPKPFNVVSLFCQDNDTQTFLRSIAQSADGRYFCYKINSEISDLKALSNAYDPTRIKLQDDKLQIGTNAQATTMDYPIDIALMYKEIFQCQSIIDRIQKIIGFVHHDSQHPPQPFTASKPAEATHASSESTLQRNLVLPSSALFSSEENGMGSMEWLRIYGIDAQKIDFFSVLQSAAFRHCDGVVRVLKPPDNTDEVTASTPANPQDKLINAMYCDQFAHVVWPDGTIRHVHVTPELHRDYERRLRALMEKIKARLKWLKKGSRDVFGAVLENNIYVLIDTSKSMQHHLDFVKEKLRLLLKDQLFAKERVNVVAFNSVLNPWRDRLTKITDSTQSAQLQSWINGLTTEGSTNTLAALRFALADPATEAIYLLTDGRPDQNERHILSQVQYRQTVPIHTIAFNCQDQTANQFLCDLARQTGGRFHAFQYGYEKETSIEIPESEDIGSLKRELLRGEDELKRIAALRDECLGRAWSRDNLPPKPTKTKNRQSNSETRSGSSPFKSQSAFDLSAPPSSATAPRRTGKKKRSTATPTRLPRPRSATDVREPSSTLNSNPTTWLLPETKDFLDGNDKKDKAASDTENEQQPEVASSPTRKIPTAYDDVKIYLKRNSLVAKGLTIFDVLHPTTVTVREPKHIQVIDRYVLAKVWDKILPLAYGSYAGKLHLINHYAVNLEKYEESLKELIANYHRFTTNFIWKHLSDEIKRELGPQLHWNSLSVEEQNRWTREISKEEYTSQSALWSFAWRQLTDAQQNDVFNTPVVYQGSNQDMLKKVLKDANATSILEGVERMDVEIQRAIKFLQISADLRQLQKRADMDSKTKQPDKPHPPVKPSVDRRTNQPSICRFDGDGFFYPGVMQKNADGRNIFIFTMGIEQEATTTHILLPTSGAIAQPHLFAHDRVLVRQKNGADEFWAPGKIIAVPSPVPQSPPLYTVEIYTPAPRYVNVYRRDLMKISLALFDQTVQYLQHINRLLVSPRGGGGRGGGGHGGTMSDAAIEDAIRKGLKPITDQLEQCRELNQRLYYQLKKELETHTIAIRRLQEAMRTTRSDPTPPEPPPIPVPPADDSIESNTPVYALWADYDNFVYQGTVQRRATETSYAVYFSNLPAHNSIIERRHIFLQTQRKRLSSLKERSCALIQYRQDYRNCWQPAVVRKFDQEASEADVRFYDCDDQKRTVSLNEMVIPISEQKFRDLTTRRIDYEKSLLNQVIVGYNHTRNAYMLGTIIKRMEWGHTFLIRWSDDTETTQEEEHLFGAFSKPADVEVGCLVLALDDDQYIYRPAKVQNIFNDQKTLIVRFLDATDARDVNVSSVTAFVITTAYYDEFLRP